jgi:hypothetical protein
MTVSTETATVYRGGGRRYFTRHAAERAEAKAAIKSQCECDRGDHVTPPYACGYHRDPVRYQRMIRLYVAMFVKPLRALQSKGPEV